MPKKLVVFGGKGFVGENMVGVARRQGWEVFLADHSPLVEPEWLRVDITSAKTVDEVIERLQPDAVVNVAAIADIDFVEREPFLAHQVNVTGAANIAASCARRGIRYVFFSSDAVFDGEGGPYSEDDAPNPVNYYGKTKLEAEQAVLTAHPAAAVIRISLVLGYPVTSGNSFYASLESKLAAGQEVNAPTYEIRTPIDVITLAECVLELCQNGFRGILHLGSTGSIDRYTLTRNLAERMGYSAQLVKPQEQVDIRPGRAPRHKNGRIRVTKAQACLKTRLLTTHESIERAFEERPR